MEKYYPESLFLWLQEGYNSVEGKRILGKSQKSLFIEEAFESRKIT
jgi:hypothetical protein